MCSKAIPTKFSWRQILCEFWIHTRLEQKSNSSIKDFLFALFIFEIYVSSAEHCPCHDFDQIIHINFGPSAHRWMILISTDLQYFSRLRYVYLLQKGKQTRIDWKCKFIKVLFYSASSSGLNWILLFLLAIMRTVQVPQEPPKSSVGQSQYTCSWCPRVCQPVFSQCPGCMMCDTVARLPQLCLVPSPHIAKLSAGPSLVRARAASPVPELCSFLSGPGAANMTGRHTQTVSQSVTILGPVWSHPTSLSTTTTTTAVPRIATTATVVIRSVRKVG